MKIYVFLALFCCLSMLASAQITNDNCSSPIALASGKEVCSANGQYTTAGATSTFQNGSNDVWFTYTPRDAYDVFVTVYGAGNGGTLQAPSIRFFSNCGYPSGTYTELFATPTTRNNVTTLYEGSLTIGKTYYIAVSGSNTGTFKICIQNQNAPVKAGQDCATARNLCSMDPVRETGITGAGSVRDEGAGTCMDNGDRNSETNSAWYKWTAANTGTFVFTITPTVATDDLDWAFFDLGIAGDCNSKSVIACADGSGVTCSGEEFYTQTGLDFNSVDIRESAGCGKSEDGRPKDGKIKSVTLIKDHVYALLINNPYSQGNGFTLEFTDQNGLAGTALFVGPKAPISFQANTPCVQGQTFTFSTQPTSTASLKWNFGEAGDASLTSATTNGPFTISYRNLGTKTVVLEATGPNGCATLETKTFTVGLKPFTPIVTASPGPYCTGDTLLLTASGAIGDSFTYIWTGPNSYTANGKTIAIPLTSTALNGVYTVYLTENGCTSDPGTYTVSGILDKPIAAFITSPTLPAKLSFPVIVKFTNKSTGSDSWLWDFGDGTTSKEENPEHTYQSRGDYTVTLTATNANSCSSSVMHGTFVIRAYNSLFIPNTFTPNGDGINDELVITLTNMTNYHISIFTRWGNKVFESASIFENWTGMMNGKSLPVGTYYYLITAVDADQVNVKRSGSVTLIR